MPPINEIHCFTRRLLPWFIYPDVYQHNRKYPESAGGSSCLRYRSKSTIIIPRDSYLLITTHEGEDVPENYKTGMWSVSRNDWILSPEPGFPVTSMADDILCSFLIGHTEYDMDFKPYEPGSETYNLENGIVLHNQMENGNYYIADSDGNPYLTAQEFFEHNHITDAILSEDGTRFCDLQGNILYPEWDYNYVSLVTDQYENINHRILCFSLETETNTRSMMHPVKKKGVYSHQKKLPILFMFWVWTPMPFRVCHPA